MLLRLIELSFDWLSDCRNLCNILTMESIGLATVCYKPTCLSAFKGTPRQTKPRNISNSIIIIQVIAFHPYVYFFIYFILWNKNGRPIATIWPCILNGMSYIFLQNIYICYRKIFIYCIFPLVVNNFNGKTGKTSPTFLIIHLS